MNDDTRLDCSDYDYDKRPQARGILTDTDQERARQMLREISEKKPLYSSEERKMLKKLWLQKNMSPKCYLENGESKEYEQPFPPRHYTDQEFVEIKLIYGRIRKLKQGEAKPDITARVIESAAD